MSEIADKLRAAKALIEDPKHWTTGCFARDANGQSVLWEGSRAVCWCAAGAAFRTGASVGVLQEAAGDKSIIVTNELGGHPAVMAMYDRAIAKAEGAS